MKIQKCLHEPRPRTIQTKLGTKNSLPGKWDDCDLKADQTPIGLASVMSSRLMFIDESAGPIQSFGWLHSETALFMNPPFQEAVSAESVAVQLEIRVQKTENRITRLAKWAQSNGFWGYCLHLISSPQKTRDLVVVLRDNPATATLAGGACFQWGLSGDLVHVPPSGSCSSPELWPTAKSIT
jgi:hypothetical protein